MENTAQQLAEFFEYLDELRESGVTNMFGAGAYLESAFDMPKKDAGAVLLLWMNTFDSEKTPSERAASAVTLATT